MSQSWELTQQESSRLGQLEAIIQTNIKGYYQAGAALLEIRDARLYRADFENFDDYCRDKWGMSKTHANRLVEAVEVVGDLTPIGVNGCPPNEWDIPDNEAQARELGKVASGKRAEVWHKAVATAPPTGITAQHVRNTARPFVQKLVAKDASAQRGFPSEAHREGATLLILNTRDPRGTIAEFVGVHHSVVSNLMYTTTEVRTALEETRENAYLTVAAAIGKTAEEAREFLETHRGNLVVKK